MIKIIRGFDKRRPVQVFDLGDGNGLAVQVEGSNLATNNVEVLFGGTHRGRDGEERVETTRHNGQFSLTYNLYGAGGPARLQQLQSDLFLLEHFVKEYEQHRRGEPVYLAYRTEDGLDLPEPVLGQFSTYLRILHIDMKSWGNSVFNPGVRKAAWNVACTLTVAPWAEGHEQDCGKATGSLKVDSRWGLIPIAGDTNYNRLANPSFGHGTWDHGWGISTSAGLGQKRRIVLPDTPNESAVLVTHAGATGGTRLFQTLTADGSHQFLSFYAKLPDGSVPDSDDFQVVIDDNAVTTHFIDNGDGWYRCWGQATTVNLNEGAYGVDVKPGRKGVFTRFQLEDDVLNTDLDDDQIMPRPFMNGDYLGASWTGNHHETITITEEGHVAYQMPDDVADEMTIAGWFYPSGNVFEENTGTKGTIWSYEEASREYALYANVVSGETTISLKAGASDFHFFPNTGRNLMHIVVKWQHNGGNQNVEVYVNGERGIFGSTTGDSLSGAGTFRLGKGTEHTTRSGWAIDGLKIWNRFLSEANIVQLYNNEKGVKDNGDLLGIPPFLWTWDFSSDQNQVDNEMETPGEYNWAVIGGVSGDLPAETELTYSNSGGFLTQQDNGTLYVGLKPVPYARNANMIDLFWYLPPFTESTSGSGEFYAHTIDHQDRDLLKGEHFMIVVLGNTAGAAGGSHSYRTRSGVGHTLIDWNSRSFDSSGETDLAVVDVADLVFMWPDRFTPDQVSAQVFVDPVLTSSWMIDHMVLMPRPLAKIVGQAMDSGDIANVHIILRGTEAYGCNSSGEFEIAHNIGDVIEVLPGHLNWLFHLEHEGQDFNPENHYFVTGKITPHLNLPGGPIS